MTRPVRGVDVLIIACQAAMAVTGLAWVVHGQFAFAAVATVALVLSLIPSRCIAQPELRDAVRGVSAILLAAHIVLGMGFALYETSNVYDKVMHLIGFGAITVLLLLAADLYDRQRAQALPTGLIAYLALGGAISAGTAWELFEFSVDLTGWFIAQRGLEDTMLDLAADASSARNTWCVV